MLTLINYEKYFRKYSVLIYKIKINMTNLELVEATMTKYGIKYHKLVEGLSTYIMPFKENDIDGYIYVEGHGLIKLTKSEQFNNFMEFYKGNIASF